MQRGKEQAELHHQHSLQHRQKKSQWQPTPHLLEGHPNRLQRGWARAHHLDKYHLIDEFRQTCICWVLYQDRRNRLRTGGWFLLDSLANRVWWFARSNALLAGEPLCTYLETTICMSPAMREVDNPFLNPNCKFEVVKYWGYARRIGIDHSRTLLRVGASGTGQ